MKFLLPDPTEGASRPVLKPEERLLLAVVDSAYWDLQSPDPARHRTARSYFLEEDDQHAFSFLAICQHFSWSPASIRSQLGALLNGQPSAGELTAANGGKVPSVAPQR